MPAFLAPVQACDLPRALFTMVGLPMRATTWQSSAPALQVSVEARPRNHRHLGCPIGGLSGWFCAGHVLTSRSSKIKLDNGLPPSPPLPSLGASPPTPPAHWITVTKLGGWFCWGPVGVHLCSLVRFSNWAINWDTGIGVTPSPSPFIRLGEGRQRTRRR